MLSGLVSIGQRLVKEYRAQHRPKSGQRVQSAAHRDHTCHHCDPLSAPLSTSLMAQPQQPQRARRVPYCPLVSLCLRLALILGALVLGRADSGKGIDPGSPAPLGQCIPLDLLGPKELVEKERADDLRHGLAQCGRHGAAAAVVQGHVAARKEPRMRHVRGTEAKPGTRSVQQKGYWTFCRSTVVAGSERSDTDLQSQCDVET